MIYILRKLGRVAHVARNEMVVLPVSGNAAGACESVRGRCRHPRMRVSVIAACAACRFNGVSTRPAPPAYLALRLWASKPMTLLLKV